MADGTPHWQRDVEERSVISADGTEIFYEVLGEGRDLLLLANGLGGRLYSWEPLIERYRDRYRIICWDYRGLFESATPKSKRALAINRHVDDAVAILRKEEHRRAVIVGWSMGVQVALDVAATHPELVAGLVLLNGTYGHAFRSGFQPCFAIPGVPRLLQRVSELALRQPVPLPILRAIALRLKGLYLLGFAAYVGPRALALRPALHQYLSDVLGPSFENYMILFQELDAHSVYHVLPEIEAPALVVSGLLDPLTPARQSFEIARRLPDAEHLPLIRAGHFSLLERPVKVLEAVDRFLAERARF